MTGIGTEINEKGFELYNEAAGKKDGDIQNILELPHDKISIIKLQVMIIKLRYINQVNFMKLEKVLKKI